MKPALLRKIARAAGALLALAFILVGATALWRHYMISPWTRDARLRAETVIVAPEIHGVVTNLGVRDNQTVRKGDLLFTIDREDYRIARDEARATLEGLIHAQKLAEFKAAGRKRLSELAISQEDRQNFDSAAAIAASATLAAKVRLERAERDLARTEVRAPVNGVVINLRLRVGDYASEGKAAVAIVDSDSFWLAGYFEETQLAAIQTGAPAEFILMGHPGRILTGKVESISAGIADQNASSAADLPSINPVFTWVRLAQRIPVRIAIDPPPGDITLTAGLTATVTIGKPSTLADDLAFGWRFWRQKLV